MEYDYNKERNDMVEMQLVPRGVVSSAVLDAMRNVPRHMFVPENIKSKELLPVRFVPMVGG